MLLTLAMVARAATVCVPADYDATGSDCDLAADRFATLPDAITHLSTVQGDHTVRVQEGYVESDPVTIDGADAFASLTLLGDGAGASFDGEAEDNGLVEVLGTATAVLDNLSFSPDVDSRAIHVEDGDVQLLRVTVQGQAGTMAKSAVVLSAGTLLVEASTFQDWSSNTNGAAIDASGPTTVRNSTFQDLSARNGGAIDASADLLVEGSTFQDGSAQTGGAIRFTASGAALTLRDSTFQANQASSGFLGGGALFLGDGDQALFEGCTFDGNTSAEDGGAAFVSAGFAGGITVTDTTFQANIADADGGAIYLSFLFGQASSLASVGSSYLDNTAGDQGGALGCPADVCASKGDVFEGNSAAEGGAIFTGSDLRVDASTFCSNVSSENGGAIAGTGGGPIDVTASVFLSNTATTEGGGIDIRAPGQNDDPTYGDDQLCRHCTFAANSAATGAAIDGPARLVDSVLLSHASEPLSDVTQVGVQAFWDNTPQPAGSAAVLVADPLVTAPTVCSLASITPPATSLLVDAGADGLTIGALEPDGSRVDVPEFVEDLDADGYGSDVDCDDEDPDVNPGADEICDADDIDEDCDGFADDEDPDGATGTSTRYLDSDGDGYGDPLTAFTTCDAGVEVGTDCDDTDEDVSPEATEATCNGVDDDCDPLTPDAPDADGDGAPMCDDCDDTDPVRSPDFQEACDVDDVDEDCDGLADDADPEGATGTSTRYLDADSDGYGDPSTGFATCEDGGVELGTDCDDADEDVSPEATETTCNGVDDDCDPLTPDAPDADGDGTSVCDDDCDDTDPRRSPAFQEVCDADEIDEDCDGLADDADPEGAEGTTSFFADTDGDGYGAGTVVEACDSGSGVPNDDDCDDTDATISPGADEVWYDGVDQDCDDRDDDQDDDGFVLADDCDDTDAARFPGNPEVPDDRIDQDCDGIDTEWSYRSGCGCTQPGGGPSPLVLPLAALLLTLRRRRAEVDVTPGSP